MRKYILFPIVFISIIISFSFVSNEKVYGQTLSMSLTQPPPGKFGMADLWKVAITNTTNETYRVYFYGTLTEKDAGLIATATTTEIDIKPGITNIKGSDFPTPDVSYPNKDPKYKEALIKTGNVPSGDYEYCVYAKLKKNNEELGMDCIGIIIIDEEMISLISPGNNDEIEPNSQIMFKWILAKPQQRTKFTIKIAEIPEGQTPERAIQNRALFEKDEILVTNFNYPSSAPKFIEGKNYAWMVKTKNSESEIWKFKYGTGGVGQQVRIDLISPTEKDSSIGSNPVFKFKASTVPAGCTFKIKIVKVDENEDPNIVINEKTPLIEERGIREQFWKPPERTKLLDTNITYAWKVEAIGSNGTIIGFSRTAVIAWDNFWCNCYPFYPSVGNNLVFCQGANFSYPCMGINWSGFFCPSGGTRKWRWKLDNNYGSWTNSCSPFNISMLTPGSYTITNSVKVLRASGNEICSERSYTRTFEIRPSISGAVIRQNGLPIPDNKVCYTEDAQLIIPSLVGSNFPITWYFRERPATGCIHPPSNPDLNFGNWSTWKSWATGNPRNTNPFGSENISGFGGCPNIWGHFQRQYIACFGNEPPTNVSVSCKTQLLNPVTVWCASVAGTIGPGTGDLQFCGTPSGILTLTGYSPCATLQWCVDGIDVATATTNTFNLTLLPSTVLPNGDEHMISVRVKNGDCGVEEARRKVTVFPKICPTNPPMYITCVNEDGNPPISLNLSEVCPNGRATLSLNNIPSTLTSPSPHYRIKWEYQKNCQGPWTEAITSNATSWNTNDIGPFWMYDITPPPNPCAWSLCWRATIYNNDYPLHVGDPGYNPDCDYCVILPPYTINIIPKPLPPTISCTGGWNPNCTKCEGNAIQLTATPVGCNNPNTLTYQWFLDGIPKTGIGNNQNYSAIPPGNYTVRVYNKNKCDYAETNFVVKDCIFEMNIKKTPEDPCCVHPGQSISLNVRDNNNGLIFSSCGGTYTYQWLKNGTAIANATSPDLNNVVPFTGTPDPCNTHVSYSVKITDGKGCTKTKSISLLICP